MSRNPLRYIPSAADRQPKTIAQLSRVQLHARITVLRQVLDLLWTQSDYDSGEAFHGIGGLKKELLSLEGDLRDRDKQAPTTTLVDAVTIPAATARLKAAGAELHSVFAPTEKQVAFYQRLVDSPVFSENERRLALDWLATKATRQTIKDQIDWLKLQVETRQPVGAR